MSERTSDLTDLLVRHTPSDRDEQEHVTRMRALVAVGPSALARDHYVPGHFTASAFVLSPTRDALLLIYHGKLQRWLQPGGHVDPSDGSLLEAARRELREETGVHETELACEGAFDLDVRDIPARKSEPAHAHFDVRFLFVAKKLEACAASDAKAVRWVPLAEVNESSSDRSVMRAVEKIRALGSARERV